MNNPIVQQVLQALLIAAILGLLKLYRDFEQWKTKVGPVVTWYEKTSMDALKIATNPTSERLKELADRYIASVREGGEISVQEKQELINGLREVMNNREEFAAKRQSASMSLRFIENREGLTAQGNH